MENGLGRGNNMENAYRNKPEKVFCKNCVHLEWQDITHNCIVPGNCLIPEDYIDPIYGPQKCYYLAMNKNRNFDCKYFQTKPKPTPEEIAESNQAAKQVFYIFCGILIFLLSVFLFLMLIYGN